VAASWNTTIAWQNFIGGDSASINEDLAVYSCLDEIGFPRPSIVGRAAGTDNHHLPTCTCAFSEPFSTSYNVKEGVKEDVLFSSTEVSEAGVEENDLEECDESKSEHSVMILRPSSKASVVRHWLSCA
jgi:hypothetical protein